MSSLCGQVCRGYSLPIQEVGTFGFGIEEMFGCSQVSRVDS